MFPQVLPYARYEQVISEVRLYSLTTSKWAPLFLTAVVQKGNTHVTRRLIAL
jgi:hypothetical protein